MTINYKEVAETLCDAMGYTAHPHQKALQSAITLCLLAAKLPPGEAERVLGAAVLNRADDELLQERRARRVIRELLERHRSLTNDSCTCPTCVYWKGATL